MKTKIRRYSKSVLSVILAMTLIMSTMLIGTISVNATGANNNVFAAGDYLYFDFSSFANSNSTIEANILEQAYIDTTDTTNYVNTNYFNSISGVVKVKLKKEINFSNYSGLLFKTNKNWNTAVNGVANPLPSDGQNTLVITYENSSYSYTWSTTGSGSGSGGGETDNYDTHIYALTTQSANMKLHAWNVGSSGLSDGSNNPMSLVATYNNGSNDFYLWKIGYNMQSNNPRFIIYSNSASLTNDTKLTTDVTGVNTAGDYFFDLKEVELGKPSISSATETYTPLTVSGSLTTSNTFNVGDSVDLSTAFTGLAITGSVYKYLNSAYTTTYAIDDNTVSSPWIATAGTHTIIATISGGKDTSDNVFDSVSSAEASFTVNSSSTHNVTVGTHENGDVQLVSTLPAAEGNPFTFKVKANEGYEINTVSLSTGTDVTAGDTDGDGYKHYTFTMPATDVTINATFKATSTPRKKFALIGSNITDTEKKSAGFVTDFTSNQALKFDDNNQITVVVSNATKDDGAESRFQIISDSDTIYKSTESRAPISTDSENTATVSDTGKSFGFSGTGTGTYTITITSYTDTEVKFTVSKAVEKYTVTAGTCAGGTVTVGGSTSSVEVASGTQIPVVATAAENYEFVSWVAEPSDCVTFSDSSSATTMATITGNATITATFRSSSTKEWNSVALIGGTLNGNSLGDWSSDSSYSFTYNEEDDTWYSDPIEFTNNTNSFKARVNGSWDYPSFGDGVVGDSGEGNFTETLNGTYIFYVKDGSPIGTGLQYKDASTPTPNLSLSPTSANLAVGGTLTLKVTHTDCEGTVSYASNAEGVATVSESGVVTAVAKGTATITAICTNGEKATCEITVSTIPYAQADRIYAYAKTLGADETPALNAWVASETNASKLDMHNDKGNVKPTLGKTSDTNIRIFLPTTASSDKVVLYNSFSTSITVNGTEIQSGKYAEVSYTPNKEYTISNGKKLTIYKSTADGALYVNNTGDYASIDNNGALSMINKLYSDKEKGEIAAGNAGALADSNGVKDVAVKKIKGRGNSTWVSANKKSFNVTFTDNINAFGFKQGKKFSLLANFKDPSLSRNKILYELADLMGVKYSPDAATVDLYMNGLYMGSYLMCQKVDVGSKELVNDLGKTLLEDLYTDSVSGTVPESAADKIKSSGFSFLMELDSNAGQGDFYITVDSQDITIKEPEFLDESGNIPTDAVTKAAQEFVQTKYTELNTAMSNTNITLEELNNIIDVESLAKYYLINEIAKNYDIGVSSTYLVYNYTEGKFYISPLWDMDVTTGNCKATDANYQRYEGNWTDNTDEKTGNKFMALVFNNPQVQSAARKLWTGSYYTTLTNYIDTLTTKATKVEGSLNCNYTKWNYPYGFQGKYDDDVQALTSLKVATYNPSDNTYTVASSSTSYATTAVGQTQYVSDWLKSRVAWMSKKYNTYYLTGDFASSWGSAYTMANNSGINTYAVENVSSGDHTFKICTDGGLSTNTENGTAYRDWSATSISYNADLNLVSDTSKITNLAVESSHNNITFTTSEAMTVYFTFNQKTNTLTLSDKQSTSTNPSVTLSGSTVDNADIKDGTAVTLTATITPATNNSVVVTGDYTATLYIGERVVKTEKVNFTDTDESKVVTFSTYLEGTNQTYKVVVTCNDGEQVRTGTSNAVIYKQTGVKDQKIYFDPSTYVLNSVATWLNKITETSTVTVTIKDSNSTQLATFKMYIDSEDVYGLAKGVFRADIDETTLGYLKVTTNTIHFELDGEDISTDSDGITINGDANIESGWIYNYSTQTTDNQRRWEQYNVSYVEAYPSSRTDSNYSNITTFAQFKDYIAAQKAAYDKREPTDNIVYFDNSVSKWYNVYIYGWGSTGPTKDAVIMNKLPYADIWYYDFGSDNVTSSFLFKDRSSFGFGNNYQETVDLVDGYIKNGDGDDVQLFFEKTLQERANPIFVTQSFYNSTIKVSENSDKTLKYRAFNTQWDEFATILSNTVQTKAVDVYFDLHDKATDVANIQLYHSSTNYKFASPFTRLNQMPGSTIFHASIKLPYTDNGIAFKFENFVVNYSGGSTKTCAMSAKVQPEFTCINTGEVWYEINSDFANLGYDTSASSASLLTANSPLLTAGSSDKVYFDNSILKWSNVYVYFYSGAYWSTKGTGSRTTPGTQDDKTAFSGTCMNEGGAGYAMTDSDGDGIYEYSLDGFTGATCIAFTNTSQTGYEFFHGDGVQVVYRGDLATNISSGTTLYTPSNKLNATLNGAVKYYNDGTWSQAPTTTSSVFKSGTTIYFNFSGSNATSANILTTTYNPKAYAWHSDISADDIDDTKIIPIVLKADLDISKYSDRLYNINNQGDSGDSWIDKKNDTNILPTEGQNMVVINADGTYYWDTYGSSSPTPTISLSPASTSLTLVDGIATTTLTTTKTNADDAKVTYTVDLSTGTVSDDGTTFTATAAGTYTVTASITVNGTTYSSESVTIKVADEVTKDYCGVLAYNHSTATFDVTGGGTIDKTEVVLTNGYYKTTGTVTTGYTSYDGTTYTVIYALPSTASSGATTSYSSTTSHSNAGTGEGQYTFDGWTKDGVISTESITLSDSISGIATVAYIANWSEEVMVTYTFTYVYNMYDTKANGKEYHENGAVITNSDYKVQVSLSVNATRTDVIAAYLANAPKISSDYFTYIFDDTDVAISTDLTNHTAEATAKIASVKKYKVTFNDEDGIVSADEYFYQNIVTLKQSAPSGYVTVWKDEKGNTLYVGDSYSFRITRNIIIESESVTSSSLKPATYVNEPTYEFFTSGTTEYVKFKVRVDNVLAGVTPYKYGTLYFFTDENGVPVDSTISVDSNIDSDKLTAAALGSASTGIKKYDATDIVNADHKFIYAPYIKNTAANRDRYLRVYSYYIYKNKEGNDVVVISSDSVLASIRNALNES